MQYHSIQPYTKDEAESVFKQGTSEQITEALLGVTYYEEDWRWVQTACVALLAGSDPAVQWTAIQCLGHLAIFHSTLDLAIVLPALQAHAFDPVLASKVSNTLSDLAVMIRRNPHLVTNWNDLPMSIKEALREEGVLDNEEK